MSKPSDDGARDGSALKPVYIDSLRPSPGGPGPFRRGALFCHLQAADLSPEAIDALHGLAQRIGLRRAWFQDASKASWPHYDIAGKAKRDAAIAAGAIAEGDKEGALRRLAVRRVGALSTASGEKL